jgi:hypothetical protein
MFTELKSKWTFLRETKCALLERGKKVLLSLVKVDNFEEEGKEVSGRTLKQPNV